MKAGRFGLGQRKKTRRGLGVEFREAIDIANCPPDAVGGGGSFLRLKTVTERGGLPLRHAELTSGMARR
jgi:hypothetical protein